MLNIYAERPFAANLRKVSCADKAAVEVARSNVCFFGADNKDRYDERTGSFRDAFISFSERFERMPVTPGRRRNVLSTKAL